MGSIPANAAFAQLIGVIVVKVFADVLFLFSIRLVTKRCAELHAHIDHHVYVGGGCRVECYVFEHVVAVTDTLTEGSALYFVEY